MAICLSFSAICSIKKVGLWSDFGPTGSDFGPILSKLYRMKADMLIPLFFAFSSMLSRYSWLTLIDNRAFFNDRTFHLLNREKFNANASSAKVIGHFFGQF